MNVVCGRCQTEYDFDDVLVSEQGTSVRCTNCGFQFRVHAEKNLAAPSRERWVVRNSGGITQTFPSLHGLQQAIRDGLVSIDDSLSRDGQPFRPLRSLEDLRAFFDGTQAKEEPNWRRGTLLGVGDDLPPSSPSAPAQPFERSQSAPPEAPTDADQAPSALQPGSLDPGLGPVTGYPSAHLAPPNVPSDAATTPSSATATNWLAAPIPVGADRQYPPPSPQAHQFGVPAQQSLEAGAPRQAHAPGPDDGYPDYTQHSSDQQHPSALQHAEEQSLRHQGITRRNRRGSIGPSEVPASDPLAARFATQPPPPLTVPPPPRRASGMRWVVALVLVGGLGLAAGTVGKDYIRQFVIPKTASSLEKSDVPAHIADAKQLLLSGDIEAAEEMLTKAAASNAANVDIDRALLRLATARADVAWLDHRIRQSTLDRARAQSSPGAKTRTRRSNSGANDERVRLLMQELNSSSLRMRPLVQRLDRALDQFQKYGDETHSSGAVVANALRVLGRLKTARATLSNTTSTRSGTDTSETAYVLAMLDAAEKNPTWTAVSERLKRAADAESGLDRAVVARIWALSQQDRLQEASSELAELTKSSSETERQPLGGASPFQQLGPALTVLLDVSKPLRPAETQVNPATQDKTARTPAPTRLSPNRSPRELVAAAERYKLKGDLSKARGLYSSALSQEPGNVQAITGLGDIARKSGNLDLAMRQYDAALRQSPNHQPAVVGSADIKWIRGQRKAATALYRRIPAGSPFYAKASRRIEEFTAWTSSGSRAKASAREESAATDDLLKDRTSTPPGPLPQEGAGADGRDTIPGGNARLPTPGTAPNIDTTDLPE